jgi:hypothetical protein
MGQAWVPLNGCSISRNGPLLPSYVAAREAVVPHEVDAGASYSVLEVHAGGGRIKRLVRLQFV